MGGAEEKEKEGIEGTAKEGGGKIGEGVDVRAWERISKDGKGLRKDRHKRRWDGRRERREIKEGEIF